MLCPLQNKFGILLLAGFCFSAVSVISVNNSSINRKKSDISPFKPTSNNSMLFYAEPGEDELTNTNCDFIGPAFLNNLFIYKNYFIPPFYFNCFNEDRLSNKPLPVFIRIRVFRL